MTVDYGVRHYRDEENAVAWEECSLGSAFSTHDVLAQHYDAPRAPWVDKKKVHEPRDTFDEPVC